MKIEHILLVLHVDFDLVCSLRVPDREGGVYCDLRLISVAARAQESAYYSSLIGRTAGAVI